MPVVIAAILGLCLGSFFNAVALRLESDQRILFARSLCFSCRKPLRWFELLPLVSFLIQKGRCRRCNASLPLRYPIVELATGLWVGLFVWRFRFLLAAAVALPYWVTLSGYFLLLSILFIIALYDLRTYLVPDVLILIGIAGWLLKILSSFLSPLFSFGTTLSPPPTGPLHYFFPELHTHWQFFLNGLAGALFFAILYYLTKKRGVGLGDAKIAFLLGLYVQPAELILSVFLSFLFGTIVALPLLATRQVAFKSAVPFAPFLFAGTFTTIVFGNSLTSIYFSLVGK